jgi:hypothetical protein
MKKICSVLKAQQNVVQLQAWHPQVEVLVSEASPSLPSKQQLEVHSRQDFPVSFF